MRPSSPPTRWKWLMRMPMADPSSHHDQKLAHLVITTLNKWKTRTIWCIPIGSTDGESDGLLFYHLPLKQTFTANDGIKFDTFLLAGPRFHEQFDGSFIFNTKGWESRIHRPPTHEQEGNTVWIKQEDDQYKPATVLSPPIEDENKHYQLQDKETGDIIEIQDPEMDHGPHASIEDHLPSATKHPPWFGLLLWYNPMPRSHYTYPLQWMLLSKQVDLITKRTSSCSAQANQTRMT